MKMPPRNPPGVSGGKATKTSFRTFTSSVEFVIENREKKALNIGGTEKKRKSGGETNEKTKIFTDLKRAAMYFLFFYAPVFVESLVPMLLSPLSEMR
jgi:hypothetical protein